MFLFIHGSGASSSLWLPQIRGLLGLNKTFSDKEILDYFTISLPGHTKNDIDFDEKFVFEIIHKFIETNSKKQSEMAQKMILTHQPEIIAGLKSPKLILIGHSVGAALCLQYSLFHPSKVEKIVSISCGDKFNPVVMWFRNWMNKAIFSLDIKVIGRIPSYPISRREKVKFNIFAENPKRKGFLSSQKIAQNFNFLTLFDKLSLEGQLKFIKIPVLIIVGQFDILARPDSALRLQSILDPRSNLLKTKKTIIETKRSQLMEMVEVQIYPWSGHNPMDSNLLNFVQDTRDFIRNK